MLDNDRENRTVSEGNKKVKPKKITPGRDTEEIATVRTLCRMSDSRQIKLLGFGILEGNNKVGRLYRWLATS